MGILSSGVEGLIGSFWVDGERVSERERVSESVRYNSTV